MERLYKLVNAASESDAAIQDQARQELVNSRAATRKTSALGGR